MMLMMLWNVVDEGGKKKLREAKADEGYGHCRFPKGAEAEMAHEQQQGYL